MTMSFMERFQRHRTLYLSIVALLCLAAGWAAYRYFSMERYTGTSRIRVDLRYPDMRLVTRNLAELPKDVADTPMLRGLVDEALVFHYEEDETRLSLEGSLKLKEISYVHSDAYAAGELKHGTISLITDGVPVIALATQKQVYEKTISNAKETKSRGAKVLLFTTQDAVVPDGVADYVVRLDDYDDLLMPLQLIVPLQLFAYYMAVLRGCDVDKPRNLAKSVTVE